MNLNQKNVSGLRSDLALFGYNSDKPNVWRKLVRLRLVRLKLMRLKFVRLKFVLLLLAISVFFTGCEFDGMEEDGFGRVRSNSGYGAIDGISGFVHLLKSRGLEVRPSSRISPLIERYDTVIWAPDRLHPPREEAIERLRKWVDNGTGNRRLIFIGPGFRSRRLLDEKQIELASDAEKERAIRRQNEKLISFGYDPYFDSVKNESCKWYTIKKIENQPIHELSGPWSVEVRTDQLEIYTGNYELQIPQRLAPKNPADNSRAKLLLAGDGHNLLYRIPRQISSYSNYAAGNSGDKSTGIFIVCNGSFIQNYGLVNPANQKLTNKIADQCKGDVLVLQSGPQPIEVTNSLAPEENGWAWLQRRPLRNIVPFFLFLATVTFFAVFPIHGRPKRIRLRPEKTFADHIRATGLLLKSSRTHDGDQWAKKTIKKYNDDSSDKK